MRERLCQLIPEFGEIGDPDLRERVIRTWERGLRDGGWQPADLERIPFTLGKREDLPSLLDHTRGVTALTLRAWGALLETYGQRLALKRDVLAAGALLHDVGKLLEYRHDGARFCATPWLRHSFTGVVLARAEGIPEEVLHVIAVHSKEGDCATRSPEALVVWHADNTNAELFS